MSRSEGGHHAVSTNKTSLQFEAQIFGHYFVVFKPQKYFVVVHLMHSKQQKLFKLVLK
jgi:hypothetical protein